MYKQGGKCNKKQNLKQKDAITKHILLYTDVEGSARGVKPRILFYWDGYCK